MDTDDVILSDVHITKIDDGPNVVKLTRFNFRVPQNTLATTSSGVNVTSTRDVDYDEDGDMIVTKQSGTLFDYDVINIYHQMSTCLSLVGLQVWRGALLMCDYVIHNKERFMGKRVLELGSGVGLTAIVMGRYAKSVLCTDVSDEILELCERNLQENNKFAQKETSVSVRRLNWFDYDEIMKVGATRPHDVIVACDCVYDDDITDALFRAIYYLMTSWNTAANPPMTYITLEKRLNFSLDELQVTCHAYNHFLECMNDMDAIDDVTVTKIDVETIPRCFEYEKVKEMELWEIKYGK